MTYAEIETGARTLLQDDKASYRWPAAEMYGYMPEAIRSLFAMRPTALFVNGRMPSTLATLEPPTATAAISASGAVTANVNDRYMQALVYYVAAKCLERDDSDTANIQLSSAYMNNFATFAKN
jgi:hypothetical protein